MLLVKTELRPSEIHGVGCFTLEKIKANQLVWTFDPRIDLRLEAEEILNFPEAIQLFFLSHGYKEIHEGNQVYVLCGDNSKYMNHSNKPNLIEGNNDNTFANIAAIDIDEGQELTCDYFAFDLEAHQKLVNLESDHFNAITSGDLYD